MPRKLLLCALARQDVAVARDVFSAMNEAAQNEPLTRYLMFKVALRGNDTELAAETLNKVYEASGKDATLLYACAMDAQQVGNKEQAIAALQLVLEKHEYNVPNGVHLPALLRCTIRLMASQIEGDKAQKTQDLEMVSEQLCKLFEGGESTYPIFQQKVNNKKRPHKRRNLELSQMPPIRSSTLVSLTGSAKMHTISP